MGNPRIIRTPEKTLKINMECILENERLAIGGAFCEFSWRWPVGPVGELVAKECRLARQEIAMYSK
jgi:hypothetical protein